MRAKMNSTAHSLRFLNSLTRREQSSPDDVPKQLAPASSQKPVLFMSGLPKLQHYVPQFLLRHFANGRKRQLHVFDKRDGRTFVASVKSVAAERGFYDVPDDVAQRAFERARQDGVDLGPLGELVLSLEPTLCRIETEAANVIGRIVREESLKAVEPRDRAILALFATLQFLRSPGQRDLFEQLRVELRTRVGPLVRAKHEDPEVEFERLGLGRMTRSTKAQMHLLHIGQAYEYLPYFFDKAWFLFKAAAGDSFYIGDNPVTLWNHGPRGPGFYGFGLGTPRSEIALPISARLCLVMLCPTLLDDSRRVARVFEKLQLLGFAPNKTGYANDYRLVEAANSGRPLLLTNARHVLQLAAGLSGEPIFVLVGWQF